MICKYCNSQIPEGSGKCSVCGKAQPKAGKVKKAFVGFISSFLAIVLAVCVRSAVKGGVEGLFSFFQSDNTPQIQVTAEELDALLSVQDLVVTDIEIGKWEDGEGTGPLLMPVLKNNGDKVVTDMTVAIAVWNAEGTSVYVTYSDGDQASSNVSTVNYSDCNFAPGETFGDDTGLGVKTDKEQLKILEAIPLRWTYEDGHQVENPYYNQWLELYENKINFHLQGAPVTPQETTEPMTEEKLNGLLAQQPLVVTGYEIDQWGDDAEGGDLLLATVQNNSDKTITKIEIAYVAWDANGNPVEVISHSGEAKGSNMAKARISDINVTPGQTIGEENGYGLSKDCKGVTKFLAIPYYYEDSEGGTWDNPYFSDWEDLYETKF